MKPLCKECYDSIVEKFVSVLERWCDAQVKNVYGRRREKGWSFLIGYPNDSEVVIWRGANSESSGSEFVKVSAMSDDRWGPREPCMIEMPTVRFLSIIMDFEV
ncbi:hypothetical protein M513_01172 [Trichuris suis]|uniref:Uncharacterized protein n=1 Tax=Trichuris suis TaxID=68888 RepID=A0A085ML43_9BILA|nr:hypothetical protein M513_01172 [Trichuris suis]